MGIIRKVVKLHQRSLLPEDTHVNVWHFLTDFAPTLEEHSATADALEQFYASIAVYMAPSMAASAGSHQIVGYNLTPGGPGPIDDLSGSPVHTRNFHPGATGQNSLPEEVALCLSIKADTTNIQEELGATRPAARRRGRVYIGPLATAAGVQDAGSERMVPLPGFVTALLTAVDTMQTSLDAEADSTAQLAVYSRMDGVARRAISAFVANDWDTQRRRGVKASSRSVVALGA